ncbi:DUF2971 domain-containing protein [Pseudomonas sp. SLFW]|uniref:DUF2971 domain-containing protein n=1 Tax=Pseudomonas sp. SLFW TaxID=2683259 RepID=UPI001413529D|nr:DUF2971 domain-containing protein [Pseudomonas sp. SLFW]NBB08488.1 DUF2971 domain-containing protein [Pseudomonas sp. SLFW]
MWAHYSQEHTGFVIGYEVDIPFLNSVNYNLIPVDRGDVVYTNSKIPHVVTSETRRLLSKLFVASMGFAFDDADRSGLETLMRKAFLIKHAAWVYEEEVRVVKPLVNHAMTIEEEYENIYFGSDTLSYEVAPGHAVSSVEGLYLYKHPIEIKEVYLGLRNPLIADGIVVSRGDSVDLDHSLRIKAEGESWKIFALEMTAGTWQLEKKRLDPFSLILVDRALEGAQSHLTGIQAKMLKEKLQTIDFDAEDNFTISNWRQRTYIKKNNDWLD